MAVWQRQGTGDAARTGTTGWIPGGLDWRDLVLVTVTFVLFLAAFFLAGLLPDPRPAASTAERPGIAVDTQRVLVKLDRGTSTRVSAGLANNGSAPGTYRVQAQGVGDLFDPATMNVTLEPGERTLLDFAVEVPENADSGLYDGRLRITTEGKTGTVPVAVLVTSQRRRHLVTDAAIRGGPSGPTAVVTVYNVGRQLRVDARLSVTVEDGAGREVEGWQSNLTVGTSRQVLHRLDSLAPGDYRVTTELVHDGERSVTSHTVSIEPGATRDALPFRATAALKLLGFLLLAGLLAVVTERIYRYVEHLELDTGDEELSWDAEAEAGTATSTAHGTDEAEERETIEVREAITCDDCGREFVSAENYRIHRNMKHD